MGAVVSASLTIGLITSLIGLVMWWTRPYLLCMIVLCLLQHGSGTQSLDQSGCVDSPLCSSSPGLCQNPDRDLVSSLCPVMCNMCDVVNDYSLIECKDNPEVNCTG